MKHKEIHPRERIMDAVTRLFHLQGYQATGINQVIEEAGVARASLYQYYPSKEKLCVAFLQRRHDSWFAQLKEFTERAAAPREKILAAFDFLYSMNEMEDYRGCTFQNMLAEITDGDEEILRIIQDHKRDLRNYLSEILKGAGAGIRDHVYLLFESALLESKIFRQQWPVIAARQIVEKMPDREFSTP